MLRSWHTSPWSWGTVFVPLPSTSVSRTQETPLPISVDVRHLRRKESKKYCSSGPRVGNNLSELMLVFFFFFLPPRIFQHSPPFPIVQTARMCSVWGGSSSTALGSAPTAVSWGQKGIWRVGAGGDGAVEVAHSIWLGLFVLSGVGCNPQAWGWVLQSKKNRGKEERSRKMYKNERFYISYDVIPWEQL